MSQQALFSMCKRARHEREERYVVENDRIKILIEKTEHGTRCRSRGRALVCAEAVWYLLSASNLAERVFVAARSTLAVLAKFASGCSLRLSDTGTKPLALKRDEVLLVMLALADGHALTPVQIQKSLFLADDKVKGAFGTRYKFEPYDYGPFDQQVYADARALSRVGLVEIGIDPRGWNTYAATPDGIARGSELRTRLSKEQDDMLARILGLVQRLSFTELVSAIYRKYPSMRAKSVFRD